MTHKPREEEGGFDGDRTSPEFRDWLAANPKGYVVGGDGVVHQAVCRHAQPDEVVPDEESVWAGRYPGLLDYASSMIYGWHDNCTECDGGVTAEDRQMLGDYIRRHQAAMRERRARGEA